MPGNNREETTTVDIEASQSLLRLMAGLVFGRGVELEGQPGSSVRDFLCEQLHLPEDYVENRIQTVFLEGKPVDDLRSARIDPGSTLALSAAMPGLVGAVFRRGGYYAALRDSITYREEQAAAAKPEQRITLKLFNLTAREIGPQILKRGVWIEGLRVADLIQTLHAEFCRGCRRFRINGKEMDVQGLPEFQWAAAPLFLKAR